MKHPTVNDYMTRDVLTLRPDAGFKEIVRALADHGVSGAPVVDQAGRVLGVVSETDLLHKEEFAVVPRPQSHRLEGHYAQAARRRATADTADQLMTAPAVTVTADTGLPQAARLMTARRVNRLPVVDADGVLVGLISRADVMGVFLVPDHEIREQVINEVIRKALWAGPDEVQVEVVDGVVTLTGVLEMEGLIPLAMDLTRAIDGVVDVVNRLTDANRTSGR